MFCGVYVQNSRGVEVFAVRLCLRVRVWKARCGPNGSMVPSRFSLSEEGITLKAHIGRGPLHEYLPTVAELDMASPLDPALLSFADKRASFSGQCAVSDLCGDAVVPVRGMQQSRDISMWDDFHMGHTNQNCSLRRGTACNNLSLLHQIKMAELCIEACVASSLPHNFVHSVLWQRAQMGRPRHPARGWW